jgi:hypothetical protein
MLPVTLFSKSTFGPEICSKKSPIRYTVEKKLTNERKIEKLEQNSDAPFGTL